MFRYKLRRAHRRLKPKQGGSLMIERNRSKTVKKMSDSCEVMIQFDPLKIGTQQIIFEVD